MPILPAVTDEDIHAAILTRYQGSRFGAGTKSVISQPMAVRRSNDFEKAFQQLEKIVQRLESEELPLDESLQLFEEGIRLSRFCNQKLEEVEKKIELILSDAKGQPRVEPFEEAELDAEGVEEEP